MTDLGTELARMHATLFTPPAEAIARRLNWLHQRIGHHAALASGAAVGRVEPLDDGLFRPVDPADGPDAGTRAVILPICDRWGGIADLVAVLVDAKGAAIETRRRLGQVEMMGEDLLDGDASGPVRLYPDPLAWSQAWDRANGNLCEDLAALRRQAHAAAGEHKPRRIYASVWQQGERIYRRAVDRLQTTARLPAVLPHWGNASPGICILDWSAPLERPLGALPALISDDAALGERLSAKLREDRRLRRAREPRLPVIAVPVAA